MFHMNPPIKSSTTYLLFMMSLSYSALSSNKQLNMPTSSSLAYETSNTPYSQTISGFMNVVDLPTNTSSSNIPNSLKHSHFTYQEPFAIPHVPPRVYYSAGDVIVGAMFVMHFYRLTILQCIRYKGYLLFRNYINLFIISINNN